LDSMTLILNCSLGILAWVRNQAKTNGSSLVGLADGVGSFVTRYPVVDSPHRWLPSGRGPITTPIVNFGVANAILAGSPFAGIIVNSIGSSGFFGSPQSSGPPAGSHQNSILVHGDAANDRRGFFLGNGPCHRPEARIGWRSLNEDVLLHDKILAGTRP
jgi:hypothetical protein